ncbi:MAG: RNA polymerase sigma factor RpoS [Gammaproteobacteria bacterium]
MIQTSTVSTTPDHTAATPWIVPEPAKRRASADPTQLYLSEIGQSPLLTADEEKSFSRAAQAGDESARHRMIKSNLRLVVKISRRYLNRGLPFLDLIEEGNLGLMHAVEKFDPERGFRFSTYATWWIRQTIERAIMNHSRTVRLPIHVIKDINACLRVRRELSQTTGRVATAEEVAASMTRPAAEVTRLFELNERVTLTVAPSITPNSDRSLVDTLPDGNLPTPSDAAQNRSVQSGLSRWLDQLSGKERTVVERRFGLSGHDTHTLEQVGKTIGVTRERVRQIQLRALANLRVVLESEGLSLADALG